MKITHTYRDFSKKNERGAYGKLTKKTFRASTHGRLCTAVAKWELSHLHMWLTERGVEEIG